MDRYVVDVVARFRGPNSRERRKQRKKRSGRNSRCADATVLYASWQKAGAAIWWELRYKDGTVKVRRTVYPLT